MSQFKNISGVPRTVPNVGSFQADEIREISPDLEEYFTNTSHFEKIEEKTSSRTKVVQADE